MTVKALKWLVLWSVVVFAAGVGTTYCVGDKRITSLQHYADSVSTAALKRDSLATVVSDQLRDSVASYKRREKTHTTAATTSAAVVAQLDTALHAAQSARDSVGVLLAERDTLKSQVKSLWSALADADSAAARADQRADFWHGQFHAATDDITRLNARIQQLTPHTPKWLKISFEVVKLGGAFYAGTQVAKH